MKPTLFSFRSFGDERGELVVLEGNRSIPFSIRRVYYIRDTKRGVERGFHAHKNLQQVAVAITGSCDMILDDGESEMTVHLNSPNRGILIEPKVWHYMKNFSDDCVLAVFADDYYDETDYIRSYKDFIDFIE